MAALTASSANSFSVERDDNSLERGLGTGLLTEPEPGGSIGTFPPALLCLSPRPPWGSSPVHASPWGVENPTVAGTEDGENSAGGLCFSEGGALEVAVVVLLEDIIVCALRRGSGTGLSTCPAGVVLGWPDGNLSRPSSSAGETLRLRERKMSRPLPSGSGGGESGSGMTIP